MIGPLRGPVLIRPFPTPHEASGLCAVGLPQFKASGLAEVFDLIAWTSAPHIAASSPGPARLTSRPHRLGQRASQRDLIGRQQREIDALKREIARLNDLLHHR